MHRCDFYGERDKELGRRGAMVAATAAHHQCLVVFVVNKCPSFSCLVFR